MASVTFKAINAVNGEVYYEREATYTSTEVVTKVYLGNVTSSGSTTFCLQLTVILDSKNYTYQSSEIPTDPEILGKKYHIVGGYFVNDGVLYELDLSNYPHTTNVSVSGNFYGDIDLYLNYAETRTATVRCILNDHVNDIQQIGIEEFEYTNISELNYFNIGSTIINGVDYDFIATGSINIDGSSQLFTFTNEIPETFNGHKFTGAKLYVDGVVMFTGYFNYGTNTLFDPDEAISGDMFNIYIEYAIDSEGDYTFKTYNGDTTGHFNNAGYIEHYILNVNDNYKELTLTITSYDNDNNMWVSEDYVLSWESDPGEGYIFDGLSDNTGELIFIPGEYDVNIYGVYTFTETFTDTDKTRFTIELSKIQDVNKNTLNKKLLNIATITGKLKDKCDVNDPIILIEYDDENTTFKSNILSANYCYIKLFGRYYFIKNIEIYRTNLYFIHCHVDVLETYKNLILNSKAMISRSTSNYNTLIFDNEIAQMNGQTVTVEKLTFNAYSPSDIESTDYIDITGNTDNECFWMFTVLGDNGGDQ